MEMTYHFNRFDGHCNGEYVDGFYGFLDKLNCEIESPGVVIVGPDESRFKDYICSMMKWRRSSLKPYPLVVLGGDDSCNHKARHNAVMELVDGGVKNVVMIYIQCFNGIDLDDISFLPISAQSPILQALALSEHPPTSDGLAYLVTIRERHE